MFILSQIPVWVFPVFVLLLVVGLRALRPRSVPVWLIYALPLLGGLSLRAVAELDAGVPGWGAFALCYGLGIWGGLGFQARYLVAVANGRAQVKGEVLTLALMMSVFAINFAAGFLRAVAPDILTSPGFVLGFIAVAAGAGGIFAGRALQVLRAARRA